MLALKKWMSPYKVSGDCYNMGSLAGGLFPYGGKWLIPPGKIDAFWQTVAVAQRDPGNYLCFVYKPLRKDLPSPLMFDIDVKTRTEIPVDVEAFVKLAKVVARAIAAKRSGNVKFCVVCKQTGYFKSLKKENDVVYATGCHLYFTNTVCDYVHSPYKENQNEIGRLYKIHFFL